ncbi:MAG: BatD family protein [Endomicrobium sp.]|jgi:hypothetical protein|nr:BatD family protein [Endomicrobium sp.]
MIKRVINIAAVLFVIVFSSAGLLKAVENADISFDKDNANVGDVINLKITARLDENENLSANQTITFNNFDVLGYSVNHISAVPNVYEINLQIAAYKTGVFEIEPVSINYIGTDGAQKQFLTPASKFEITSVLSKDDEDIKDIKPLRKLKRKAVYVVLAVILAFVSAFFAVLLFREIRKKKKEEEAAAVVLTPKEKAVKNLLELYNSYKGGHCEIKIFYYKMSEILRTYISEKYFFNALEMTTAEFFDRVKKSLPQEINVNEFKNYLKVFSLARYAGFKPSEAEIENNFNYTKLLLESL